MGPLEGTRVLDLSRLLPGGYCTQVLADLGADVIKVEQPRVGDPIRRPADLGEYSAAHWVLNRNKRSVTLDLKAEEGRQAFWRLAERAQVIVEGFRPGVADRLGVGYQAMRKVNPALVYCSISGYGQTGPLREAAGHDIDYLARSGVLSITGAPETGPVLPGVQVGDLGGGAMMAAVGILAALLRARDTGQGDYLDISMTDGLLSWLSIHAGQLWAGSTRPGYRTMVLTGAVPCYRTYRCREDGFVALGALEEKFWEAFCRGAARPEWSDRGYDPSLIGEVEAFFARRTRDEWVEHFSGVDCCLAPVLSMEEALSQALTVERQMVVTQEHPERGSLPQLGLPIKARRRPGGLRRPAPALGEHTEEVLGEAGYGPQEIVGLRRDGVI